MVVFANPNPPNHPIQVHVLELRKISKIKQNCYHKKESSYSNLRDLKESTQ